MPRNRVLLVVVGVCVVVMLLLVIGVAAFVVLSPPAATPVEAQDAESSAARVQAAPGPATGPVQDIGSGGTTQGSWYQLAFTDPKYTSTEE